MISQLDRDKAEEHRCYDTKVGMTFKSFRDGLDAGKREAKLVDLPKGGLKQCPYYLSPEVRELLKKRARWLAGYDTGWQLAKRKQQRKKKKKRRE